MKIKKLCKNKSEGRYQHYKSYGWLARIVYRLRGEDQIQHYLNTGKYIKTYGEPYMFLERVQLMVRDIYISSPVKRSRIKNIHWGCETVSRGDE